MGNLGFEELDRYMSIGRFWIQVARGFWQSLYIMAICLIGFSEGSINETGQTYGLYESGMMLFTVSVLIPNINIFILGHSISIMLVLWTASGTTIFVLSFLLESLRKLSDVYKFFQMYSPIFSHSNDSLLIESTLQVSCCKSH